VWRSEVSPSSATASMPAEAAAPASNIVTVSSWVIQNVPENGVGRVPRTSEVFVMVIV